MIEKSFEKYFFIPILGNFDVFIYIDDKNDHLYKIDPKIVNRRGIYKDVLNCELVYTDYQLRPNMCIAMVVV